LPAGSLLMTLRDPALVAFSPVHVTVPLALFAAGSLRGWLDVLQRADRPAWSLSLGAGLGLGALPWVDRSSWIPALLLAVWYAWSACRTRAGGGRAACMPLLVAAYANALVLAALHGTGQAERLWRAWTDPVGDVGPMGGTHPWLPAGYMMAVVALGAAWLGQQAGKVRPPAVWLVASGMGLLALLIPTGSVTAPTATWLMALAAVVGAAGAGALLSGAATGSPAASARAFVTGWAVAAGLAATISQGPPGIIGRLAEKWRQPRSEMAQLIWRVKSPDSTLAVWGDGLQLHAETGLRPGVAYSGSVRLLGATGGSFYHDSFLDDLRIRRPEFLVQASRPGAGPSDDGGATATALPREVAHELRLQYRRICRVGGQTLYVRSDWAHASGRLSRIGLKLAGLAGMTSVSALGGITNQNQDHLLAHAPSRLVHPVPPEARRLTGRYGFEEGAYRRPSGAGTDGAVFRVVLIGHDSSRTVAWEQRLSPVATASDRGVFGFSIDLPPGLVAQVEFVADSGDSPAFDWTFWQNLQFETDDYNNR